MQRPLYDALIFFVFLLQITDDTVVARAAALKAMYEFCEEAVDASGDEAKKKEFQEKVCLNECSNRGRCIKGVCHCDSGFATEDCSIATDQVPQLLNIAGQKCHFCDVRTSDCSSVVIRGKNIVPDRVKCEVRL